MLNITETLAALAPLIRSGSRVVVTVTHHNGTTVPLMASPQSAEWAAEAAQAAHDTAARFGVAVTFRIRRDDAEITRSACCGESYSRPAAGRGAWTCDNCHRETHGVTA